MEDIINPLRDFKVLSSMPWSEMEARTGISVPQLIRISKKTPFEMQDIHLSSALFLQWHLNVDLISHVKMHVFPELYSNEITKKSL